MIRTFTRALQTVSVIALCATGALAQTTGTGGALPEDSLLDVMVSSLMSQDEITVQDAILQTIEQNFTVEMMGDAFFTLNDVAAMVGATIEMDQQEVSAAVLEFFSGSVGLTSLDVSVTAERVSQIAATYTSTTSVLQTTATSYVTNSEITIAEAIRQSLSETFTPDVVDGATEFTLADVATLVGATLEIDQSVTNAAVLEVYSAYGYTSLDETLTVASINEVGTQFFDAAASGFVRVASSTADFVIDRTAQGEAATGQLGDLGMTVFVEGATAEINPNLPDGPALVVGGDGEREVLVTLVFDRPIYGLELDLLDYDRTYDGTNEPSDAPAAEWITEFSIAPTNVSGDLGAVAVPGRFEVSPLVDNARGQVIWENLGGVTEVSFIHRRHAAGLGIGIQTIAATIEGEGTGVSGAGGVDLSAHWEAYRAVDHLSCGREGTGDGGFGDDFVPTNSHGDVHIFTPDGLAYDYQAGGEFLLVAAESGDFEVHTRQSIHDDNPEVSSNTGVAIRMDDDIVEFYSDADGQRFYLNGELRDLPMVEIGMDAPGMFIGREEDTRTAKRFLIYSADEQTVVRVNLYDGFLNVGVVADDDLHTGLIGDMDGVSSNDLFPREGTELICPPATAEQIWTFGDSWRVTASETLLRAELDETLTVAVAEGGRRLSVEAALFEAITTQYASAEVSQSVEIDVLVSSLVETYSVEQSIALATVERYFGAYYSEESRSVSVSTLTAVARSETQVTSLETIDVSLRARAQRICQDAGITDPLALASCTYDVSLTQDETYLESAAVFQETVEVVPVEQRISARADYDFRSEEAFLSEARITEVVGTETVDFAQLRETATEIRVEEELRVRATSESQTLVQLTTSTVTGQSVSVERAVVETLEENFASFAETDEVDLSFVATLVAASYEIDEATAQEAVTAVFEETGTSIETQIVQASAVTSLVSTYEQRIETVRSEVTQEIVEARFELNETLQPIVQAEGDITSFFDPAICSEFEDVETPFEMLEAEPAARGAAIFCATHASGESLGRSLGNTLDEARELAYIACEAEAESRIEQLGDIAIPCREIGQGERTVSFGAQSVARGRELQVTTLTEIVDISTFTETLTDLRVEDGTVQATCTATGAEVSAPIEGVGVTSAGLLTYEEESTESTYTQACAELSLSEDEDGMPLLETICYNEAATNAQSTAISLLAISASETLVSAEACVPEAPVSEFAIFAEDGLEATFPHQGDFVLIASEEAGIEVQVRREEWTWDTTESVFTAMAMRIGSDLVEVSVLPEPGGITVNGLPFEDAIQPDPEDETRALLPGGGALVANEETQEVIFEWPQTSFAVSLRLFPGSHISPSIRRDEAYTYEGLARFTSDWMVEGEASAFSEPLEPACDCAE